MNDDERPLRAGRVGRPHGLDGSFYVEAAEHPLPEGTEVVIGEVTGAVDRRGGADARPLIHVAGVADRQAAQALGGEAVLVPGGREELGPEQWYDDDLVGCRVDGIGEVTAVLHGPSCDVLEVGERGVLVPLVRDAVLSVDVAARRIEVDHRFLALDEEGGPP